MRSMLHHSFFCASFRSLILFGLVLEPFQLIPSILCGIKVRRITKPSQDIKDMVTEKGFDGLGLVDRGIIMLNNIPLTNVPKCMKIIY